MTASPSPLARYLLLAYASLIVYASLHPFSGWTDPGVGPLAFLTAPLPRYIVRLEILANILGYAPLGFLAALALYPRRGIAVMVVASLASIGLSFVLEALQGYLPARTPSNLDFAANAAGGMAGATLGALLAGPLLREGGLKTARHRMFRAGSAVDAGLVLLALWLFTQLDPHSLLFGTGDLRPLFGEQPAQLHGAEVFISAEALVACANTLAVGLMIALLAHSARRMRVPILGFIAGALAIHAVGYAVFFGGDDAFNWLTPGAYLGVAVGAVMLLAALETPRAVQVALCALSLMIAAVLVNIAPENPYLADSLANWQQGYFLHFIGLTRVVSGAWPFLALAFVVSAAAPRER
jgi:VanZ family protein